MILGAGLGALGGFGMQFCNLLWQPDLEFEQMSKERMHERFEEAWPQLANCLESMLWKDYATALCCQTSKLSA